MFRHGPEHVLRAGGVVSIQRLHKGIAALEFPDCNYVHRGDVISVTDFAQPFRGAHKDAIGEGLFIPRDLLGLTHNQPFGAIVQPIESARGQRLMAEVSRFFEDTGSGRAYDRTQLIGMVRGMVARFWNPGSDREEWWLGRRKLIHKYIETHLDDPNLGPLQICGLFNMSRATLYRMFEQDGGVRRFIQDRRLLSAMWDLASGGLRRGRLSQVAERWGFSSDANFNRAVKQTFGMPPGSLFKKSVHVQTPTYRGARSSGLEHFPDQAEWLRGYRPETPDLQQYIS